MTGTYLLTPYATSEDAAAGSAPLPRVQVGDGILDVLAEVRVWFNHQDAAVVNVDRDGVPVARITAAALTATDGITWTRPGHADPGPQPAANLAQAVLLAGAHLAAASAGARASVQVAGAWLLSVDSGDFPGVADPADGERAAAPWPEWPAWRHHPPAAYIIAVADSLANGFGWTIAETSDDGFRIDLAAETPEPHPSWTDRITDADDWWARFNPARGWEYGMNFFQSDNSPGRAVRKFPLPLPADPGHPGEVAAYLDLALEHGAAYTAAARSDS
ncbi:hypothetical protein ACU686_12515 [Yinghuangia aomiensis]